MEMKFLRKTADYTLMDYKKNEEITGYNHPKQNKYIEK